MLFGFTLAGCVEPPYRYEVHDTGEGTVRVETVPKNPAVPSAPAAPVADQSETDQQKIDELQAQVRALSVENQKLKQAAPATSPAKE